MRLRNLCESHPILFNAFRCWRMYYFALCAFAPLPRKQSKPTLGVAFPRLPAHRASLAYSLQRSSATWIQVSTASKSCANMQLNPDRFEERAMLSSSTGAKLKP